MEVKIKGSENNIKKFLKTNSLFMRRNGLEIVSDDIKEEEKPEKQARKRRTKAEIEADKKDK